MGNARLHSKTGKKATARNSVRKRGRKAPRGMKTRICALAKSIKDFLFSDSYMYGPVRLEASEAGGFGPSSAPGHGRPEIGTGEEPPRERRNSSEQAAAMAGGEQEGGSEDSARREPNSEQEQEHADGSEDSGLKPVRIRLQKVERRTQVLRHHTIVPCLASTHAEEGEALGLGSPGSGQAMVPCLASPHAQEGEALPLGSPGSGYQGAGPEAMEEGDDSDPEQGNADEADSSVFYHAASGAQEPLAGDEAAKVLQQLVDKYGGRYSRELGIEVDRGEDEVERWFLASVLFNRRSSFHPSVETLRRLEEGGIRTPADVLAMEERHLTQLLESLEEPDVYNRRLSSRLQKLAQSLQAQLGGRISSLKNVPNYDELLESVGQIYGVGPSTAGVFLRELRGLWAGADPELGTRAISALRHLKLLHSEEAPHSVLLSLRGLAARGDLDVRDAETALIRFGKQHARFYRRCPGGIECETWHSIPHHTAQKHVKYD